MSVSLLSGKTTADSISAFIARTSLKSIPGAVREQANLHVLDGLATMLGGSKEESGRILREHCFAPVQGSAATVLGVPGKFSAEHAALINGLQAHALDYDDAQLATLPSRPAGQQTHPTAPVLAAALALAESRRLPGAALLVAYIAGVEVACRLGDAVDPSHYLDGFHPTGTLGVFGAVAACASLLKLAPQSIRHALGIAGTLSSGLRANRGTMAKALNAGHAAGNGVLAARLAAGGFTASQNIFDDPMGLFRAMCRDQADRRLLRFGDPFFLAVPGVAFKLYPCAGVMHPALDLTLELRRQFRIEPESIERIRVTLEEQAALPLVYDNPKSALEAKFSLHFAIAVAIVEGAAGLKQFSAKSIRNPKIRRLMRRIELAREAATEQKSRRGLDTGIEITLRSGAKHRARAAIARGHPTRPAARAEIEEKFRQCADGIVPPARIAKFLQDFLALERVPSVAAWLHALRPARR